jgi:hypothetical protein
MSRAMARLVALREAARQRYAEDNFDDAWITTMHALVVAKWQTADETTARLLVDIMMATPYPEWMVEFLIPAQNGDVPHADLLLHHFDAIASAGAEGIAREDGLTQRG